jgi:hypothetical protein
VAEARAMNAKRKSKLLTITRSFRRSNLEEPEEVVGAVVNKRLDNLCDAYPNQELLHNYRQPI